MNPAKSYEHIFSPIGGRDDSFSAPGVITFLRAPHVPLEAEALKASGARYAFLGVPYEEGNIGKPGTVEGPRDIRFMSHEYFPYWFEYQVDLHDDFVDCGDVRIPKVDPITAHNCIYKAVSEILKAGLIPVLCGGDHSITIPASKALSDHLGSAKKMGFLQFGAHLNMAESWAGEKSTSASSLARVTELPNVAPENVAHIGVRNSMNPKDWIDLADERGVKYYSMNDVLSQGVAEVTRDAASRVWNGTDSQYISIDMNVMDASAAPGVTSPEPGGLEAREIMMINEILGENGSVGMIDLTELCPVVDVNAITTKLAACAVLRLLAVIASVEGKTVDQNIKREDLKS